MNTELISFDNSQIIIKPGIVEFTGFENLKEQALQLSEHISQVEVTDKNVQISKKLLAAVNNKVKEIEDRRIAIKKEMLEPYLLFESQVKEIVTIVKEADGIVRDQVKEMEEKERELKREQIEIIFDKRINQYSFSTLFGFVNFINPKHLNKTTSMKAIETEMVQWLEKIDADIKVIQSLPNAADILAEYTDTGDLTTALTIVNEREERKKRVKQEKPAGTRTGETAFVITVYDEKDLMLLQMFMDKNDIKNNIEKVAN